MKKSYVEAKNGKRRMVELDETLMCQPGVRRFKQRDGSGREDWYWVANMMIEAKQNARRWSVLETRRQRSTCPGCCPEVGMGKIEAAKNERKSEGQRKGETKNDGKSKRNDGVEGQEKCQVESQEVALRLAIVSFLGDLEAPLRP